MIRKSSPSGSGRPRRKPGPYLSLAGVLLLYGLSAPWGVAQEKGKADIALGVFRLGFTNSVFTDINVTDVKAGMKAWTRAVVLEKNYQLEAEALIFPSLDDLKAALQRKELELIAVETGDYMALVRSIPLSPLFVIHIEGRATEEYVLLVHRDGGIKSLGDLRGRSLAVYDNPRASLAIPWLDTLLLEGGGRPTNEFIGRVSREAKLTKVILPVFFKQADACLVTRGGFEMMAALNPQVGQTLQVLSASPPLVPIVLGFRGDYESPIKEDIFQGMRELHLSTSGQQVLTIFRSNKIEAPPELELKRALDLLTHLEALKKAAGLKAGMRSK